MSLSQLFRDLYEWISDTFSDKPVKLRLSGGGYLITEKWAEQGLKLQSLKGSEAIYMEKGFICLVRIVDFAFGGQPRIWLRVSRNLVSVSYPPPPIGKSFEVSSSIPNFHISAFSFSSSVQLAYWGVYFDKNVVNKAKMLDAELETSSLADRYYQFTDLLNSCYFRGEGEPSSSD